MACVVTDNRIGWRGWLRASCQTATLLGLTLIALLWSAIEFHLRIEHRRLEAAAIQGTGNLARVFEEQIVQIIKANDRILRSLQISAVNSTLVRDFGRWALEIDRTPDFTDHLVLIDAQGRLIESTLDPATKGTDLSDDEAFRTYVNSTEDTLHISKPVQSDNTGSWSVKLTRRYLKPHGAFGGVIGASLNSRKLSEFYASVDLGRGGAIALVGLDGAVRAAAGFGDQIVGRSLSGSDLIRHARGAEEGSFVSEGQSDGIRRITSYRVLDGYPLVLSVGRAEKEVFANHSANEASYRIIGCGLTLFVLAVIAINSRRRLGLEQAQLELHASEALAREKSRELELTLDHMSQGLIMVDADKKVAVVNRRAVELLDMPDFAYARPSFATLIAHHLANNGDSADTENWDAAKAGLPGDVNLYERVRPNGITLEVRTSLLPDGAFVRTFTDITERKRSADKIAYMAHHDGLTGLANRVLLRERIETALARQRRQGESFALLLIDLDRFKAVNDTLGHPAGDELLRQVAQRLRRCVRELDTVARLGGDEFAILQIATGNRESVDVLARRIVDAVRAPFTLDGSPAAIGASIGIARSIDSPEVEQLFHNADLALYRVKSEGRNNFRLFEQQMDNAAQARRRMEEELRLAAERKEFEIHYQPMFELATGKIACVEALLRWKHPIRGLISPAEFMSLAEETGLMPDIDAWVVQSACAEAAGWPGEIMVSVNLSPAKFKRKTLVDVVRRALADSGLSAWRLELEISERIILHENDGNITLLHGLRDLGVRLALDDFGVAHSSLSDLRLFPFDKIKIDRSFVAEMESRGDCAAIVAAIAGLGRSLGAQTTAEGVETETQARMVRAAGCTQAQGYLYSKPVSAAAIRTLFSERQAGQQAVA